MSNAIRRVAITAALLILIVGTLTAPVAAANADLHVEQESYVPGDVDVDTRGDVNVYSASGDRVFIQPQNFNTSDVESFAVRESEGDLTYNENLGVYEFHATGNGTYHLYWDVREESAQGNDTVVESERYQAVIETSRTDIQTVPADRLSELQTAAGNWEEWTSKIKEIAGADANVEVKTQVALDLLNIRENPLQALTGEFWYLGVVIFGTFAGLMWALLFGLYNWYDKRALRKELNEKKALLPDRGELEEKLAELDHKDDLQSMVTTRPTDWYDDPHVGQAAVEAHGEDMLTHFSAFEEMVSGISALRDRLRAMAHAGYRVRLQRDGSEIVDAVLIEPERDGDGVVTDGGDVVAINDLDSDVFDAVHEAVDVHDPVLKGFDYSETDVDRAELREEGTVPDSLDAMLEQMDAEIERFGGDKETYGEYLQALLEDVIRRPATDSEGVPKGQRWMLEQWYRVGIEARDIFGLPLDYQTDIVRDLLSSHDPVEDAQRIAEQDRAGRDPFDQEGSD